MTISELARAVGVSTRTIRHYHHVGLLPEPARRPNGYREYGPTQLLRLIRIRRLVGLGLSLPEVAAALRPDGDRDLREILTELADDLHRQEEAARRAGATVQALLERDGDLHLSDDVAGLLPTIRAAVGPGLATVETDILQLVEHGTGEQFGRLATWYAETAAAPDTAGRVGELAQRFEALAGVSPDDPAVAELATAFSAVAEGLRPPPVTMGDTTLLGEYLQGLAPAQVRCLELTGST